MTTKEIIERINAHIKALTEDVSDLAARGYDIGRIEIAGRDRNVFLHNGIAELAAELDRRVIDQSRDFTPRREMTYKGVEFTQYPKKREPEYEGRRMPDEG